MRHILKQMLTGALFLAMLLCTTGVQAEKLDWVDKNYDFSRVKEAIIYDIELVDTDEMESDLTEKILLEEYLKVASRPPYKVMRPDSDSILHPLKSADIYVKAELLKWHDDYYIKEAYTSWETVTRTRQVKRSDGSWVEEKYYDTMPVYHPAETVYTSTVRIKFDVYDVKSDKLVMSRDELRERKASRHGQQGIFGRISKSFFDDLGKKIKNDD